MDVRILSKMNFNFSFELGFILYVENIFVICFIFKTALGAFKSHCVIKKQIKIKNLLLSLCIFFILNGPISNM